MGKKNKRTVVEVPEGAQVIHLDANAALFLKLGQELTQMVPSNGLGVALYHDAQFISSDPSIVVKLLLAYMDKADALKALFSSCECADCQEFSQFPAAALAIGYRRHFQETMEGRMAGLTPTQHRARLLDYIRQAVEV